MVRPRLHPSAVVCLTAFFASCTCTEGSKPPPDPMTTMTAAAHERYFPIGDGAMHALQKATPEGVLACNSCHRNAAVATEVSCLGCHKHPLEPINGRDVLKTLHLEAQDFDRKVPPGADVPTRSKGCYECHSLGKRLLAHFPHGGIRPGINSFCSMCHDANNPFAALPKDGFTHIPTGGVDCGACHRTESWKGASGIPMTVADPSRDLNVTTWTARYSATTMVSATQGNQTIPMTMDHAAQAIDVDLVANCGNCHARASTGQFFPGVLHGSLARLGRAQPAQCNECHGNSAPTGFVGPLDARRTPATPEMKHDAVDWMNDQPGSTHLVTADCAVCHVPSDGTLNASWAKGRTQGVIFHDNLADAGLAQPGNCLDCHANTRPTGLVSATSGVVYEHAGAGLGNCRDCHASTKSWAGGRFHGTGSTTPTTCLPCHATARPTSTANWMGTYQTSPFDYVTNSRNVKHGDGLDCVGCHNGPGTGMWGTTQNWQGGHFAHAPTSVASITCLACHTTQRPDLLTPTVDAGYDHARDGTGDCFGCHQATVARGTYVALRPIPGGDWRGGAPYPGSTLITGSGQFVQVPTTALTRTGTRVTGMVTTLTTLGNGMRHTSSSIPAQLFPGDAGQPDSTTCWHCHTSTDTTVTSFADGRFHDALANFRGAPNAAITPLPQPTSNCADCHAQMRPPDVVAKNDAGLWLLPMDHSATFTGGSVSGVAAMDCGICHQTPGNGATRWSDGVFHANVPTGATPTDCLSCHYPVTTTAAATVTDTTRFTMQHRTPALATQTCATCHATALASSTTSPTRTTLWKTGALHASLATNQPAACLDCHALTEPITATQGTEVYVLAQGGTPTNTAQWMNHTDPSVTGKDCASCHQADAKATGASWSGATSLHGHTPTTTCAKCHGVTNGAGGIIGENNNLPAGLIDTTTITSSTVTPGLKDRVTHADVNVTSLDCSACHTQAGPSTVAGIRGKEWQQANFHRAFGPSRPLVMNSSSGRCSNCHLNVKPPASAGGQDHSTFTGATGSQDCSSCHTWPGTGTASAPNWKGATPAPTDAFDPNQNVTVTSWTPRYSGPTIVSAPQGTQALSMTMNHATLTLDAGVMADCTNCHTGALAGHYYPGTLHASLRALGVPQPTACADCHASNLPVGFVGPADSRRVPITGEMKHDAVAWSGSAPTTTRLVTSDCALCHAPPTTIDPPWTNAPSGGALAYHSPLTAGGLPQPTTCLDCHANSRPTGVVTSGAVSFDHSTALGNCRDCHASTRQWAGGRYHLATNPTPTTCLPCHATERPTSTSGWLGAYSTSPFDYVTNSLGLTHGDGQDCATCHTGPGTGAWGSTQNWQKGSFTHAPTSVAASSCVACHTTQRPDRLTPPVDAGYDHAANGTGDCIGCHQATVARGTYTALLPIPGGDWRGGAAYPGSTVINAPNQFVQVQTTHLSRAGSLVTGLSTSSVTLSNAMLHTSGAIPSVLFPGPDGAPDSTTCWHCHTATGTTVTSFANGRFHAALDSYRVTPASAVTALPQPTSGCADCHDGMRPPDVVTKTDAGTWLLPMDHSATLSTGSAASLDCSTCHATPGNGPVRWSDGAFHSKLGGTTPVDCVTCHYPLMTTSSADVSASTTYAMKHRAPVVTQQACASCHRSALASAATTPATSTLWKPGQYHSSLTATTQPTACLDCHSVSEPTIATQGSVTYVLPQGGTTSNGAQWMNHADSTVTGRDCSTCHQADAKVTGSAWAKATAYHARNPTVTTCATCHGTSNGRGNVIGTSNNLPDGLTDTTTVTTSSASPGVKDQVTHADLNVTTYDCVVCHVQQGPSTTAGIQGKEWAQAKFHVNLTGSRALVLNGTTARCSNCHLSVKPAGVAGGQDHSTFTSSPGSQDCSSCHAFPGTGTRSAPNWLGATPAPQDAFDPLKDVTVASWTPRFSGPTIVSAAQATQTFHMTMNHTAQAVDAGVLNTCTNCHRAAASGVYYPGLLHSSLANLGVPQPKVCIGCHDSAQPIGFVGENDTRRTPQTGEMKHDAVEWSGTTPTTTRITTQDCSVCHLPPGAGVSATWQHGKAPDAGAVFHASLADAGLSQPASCLDCHANSRPTGLVVTSAASFDHSTALGSCRDCHSSTAHWSGGKYHLSSAPAPTTCLPCHDASRPTSTTTWMWNYTTSPFDYVTNSLGASHGDGLDCGTCHPGAGTGTWGVNQNWQNGRFTHGPTTRSATSCSSCHTTQRPDLLTPPANPGYDHATNGTGDCIGCHLATVSRGTYVALQPIPGGDWRGGQSYPGSSPINSPAQFVQVQSTALTRSGQKVTGMTTTGVTLGNAMLHTSSVIPSQVFPGPAGAPDNNSCWHCHTSTGTTVTSFSNGLFHASLTNYKATPTSAVTPLPQPTTGCNDCHAQMRPPNIVSKTDAGSTWLLPMDHAATLTTGTVSNLDCGKCHHTPGLGATRWSDGKFHSNLSGANPTECVSCHYPLMTTALADVTVPDSGIADYSMSHRSTMVTTQACATCHTAALAAAVTNPTTTLKWRPGAYHSTLTATTQPTACLDCHAATDPATTTQSTVTYTLALGGTASNGGQWMNHQDTTVNGKDCVTCHQADAKVTGSAWNHATTYHPRVTGVTVCATCHGTTNGKGTVIGTNNNLPLGLTNSSMLTTSSVSPGLYAQINHADVNVTTYDCAVCHTQRGTSTVAGIAGKEWQQAKFHTNFGTSRALLMNGTTGRCSTCHFNVKPPGLAGGLDHSSFTAASGSQDCTPCHSIPGTGTTAAPNWKGASAVPTYLSVGGFVIPVPPGSTVGALQAGITNLPHPTVPNGVACTTCHPTATPGNRPAIGYDHKSTLITMKCAACHEAGSTLVSPVWSPTTHGDTRDLNTVTLTKDQTNYTCGPKHFFPIDCDECHNLPTGNAIYTTPAFAQGTAWYVDHVHTPDNRGNMTNPSTCNQCHGSVAGCQIPQ